MIKKFCQKNSLTPKLVDNSSIAANTYINTNSRQNKHPVLVNIFNSKKIITLFVNISSKPAFVKIFNKKKEGYIKDVIDILSSEKMKSVLMRDGVNALISGGELELEIKLELEKLIRVNFYEYNPFDALKFKDVSREISLTGDDKCSYTSAIGIASRFN